MTVQLTSKQFAATLEQDRVLKLRSNPPEVMNAEEIAIFLDLHPETIYSMVQLGTIPCKREGRRLLFLRDVIREWLHNRGNA